MDRYDPYLNPSSAFFRLLEEYFKYESLYIGFDFDGTIHDFHKNGWEFPGMIELLRDLKSINCKLICWTCYKDHDYVEKYLKDSNIPFDSINTDGILIPYETRKPYFSAILDDRCGLWQVYQDLTLLVKIAKTIKKHDRKIQKSV